MEQDERLRLACAWLEVQRNWWAWSDLEGLVERQPEVAFPILVDLIALADNESLLGEIGAGPLEDFLRKHGAAFVAEVESRATSDERWRTALAGVWLPGADDDVTMRLERLGCMLITAREDAGTG